MKAAFSLFHQPPRELRQLVIERINNYSAVELNINSMSANSTMLVALLFG